MGNIKKSLRLPFKVIWLECAILGAAPITLWLLSDPFVNYCGIWAYLVLWGVWFGYGLWVLLRFRKPESRVMFPRANIKELEATLPHESLKLFQQWLVPGVLDTLYEHHITTEVANPQVMVESITCELKQALGKAPKDLKLVGDANCANAYVALIVATIALRCIAVQEPPMVGDKAVSQYRNLMTHIQWDQAKEVLFREMYRLSELSVLLQGDRVPLFLNVDLQEYLWQVLEIKKISEEKKENKDEATSAKENKAKQAPDQLLFKWIQREMQGKDIDQVGYFFRNAAEFGAKDLFISEGALNVFLKTSKLDMSTVVKCLFEKQIAEGNWYSLKRSEQPAIRVMRVKVNFEVQGLSTQFKEISAGEEKIL